LNKGLEKAPLGVPYLRWDSRSRFNDYPPVYLSVFKTLFDSLNYKPLDRLISTRGVWESEFFDDTVREGKEGTFYLKPRTLEEREIPIRIRRRNP